MNVTVTHSCNAASHEIPHGNPTIVAAYRQQRSASVEGARESLAARVQYAIVVLCSSHHQLESSSNGSLF